MSDVVLTSLVERPVDEGMTPGAKVYSLGVEKQATAIVKAVLAAYDRIDIADRLESRSGEKVTLLQSGENMLGAELVVVREGRLFSSRPGHVALLPKGKRTKGIRIDPSSVLAVFDGWVAEEARASLEAIRSELPELQPLTRERLLELPGEGQGGDCTLAVFGTHPLFGAADCLWLIGEYWPVDDIIERCVLLIRPEFGCSEPGSVFGRELLSMPVGEVVGFEPVSFEEAIGLINVDHPEALGLALGGRA